MCSAPQLRDGDQVLIAEDDCKLVHDNDKEWEDIVSKGKLWNDLLFLPTRASIEGPHKTATRTSPGPVVDGVPTCMCGVKAKTSIVQKETANKGRSYYVCGERQCGFFAWADNQGALANIVWKRFPDFVIVSDFGFTSQDLRQGAVGDCWFLSALAVVAERHDLIARLFADTAPNSAGCYNIRLFLDGEWQSVLVDDMLPCTNTSRSLDPGLAFSRAANCQLWVCLLEKAYAKAHGSYHAISGGEIAEALLDLTGAPTFSLNFDDPKFNLDVFWSRLVHYKKNQFPMGCATASNPDLRAVGLVGNHAYSILDCREVRAAHLENGRVRLLRVRNPHGVGEWNGAWSDKSAHWSQVVSSAERTGVNDGTFWIDLTSFIMAFSVVDVCFAHRGWHARSLPNAFCAKSSATRLCRSAYSLRVSRSTTLYLMALQPTKRGASHGRSDRKKSYRPGDVSLLVVRLTKEGQFAKVVGGGLHGTDLMARHAVMAELEPNHEYVVLCLNLGGPPVAGETVVASRFVVRFFSSQELRVKVVPSEQYSLLSLHAFHHGLLLLDQSETQLRYAVDTIQRQVRRIGDKQQLVVVESDGVVAILGLNHAASSVTFTVDAQVKVMLARNIGGLLENQKARAEELNAKSTKNNEPGSSNDNTGNWTCGACGASVYDRKTACWRCRAPRPGANQQDRWRGRGGFRFQARWKFFTTAATVKGGQQTLLMLLVRNGIQAKLGPISCRLIDGEARSKKEDSCSQTSSTSANKAQPQNTLKSWLSSSSSSSSSSLSSSSSSSLSSSSSSSSSCPGLFHPVPIVAADVLYKKSHAEDDVQKALEQSLLHSKSEETLLQKVLEQSLINSGPSLETILQQSHKQHEIEQKLAFEYALEQSRKDYVSGRNDEQKLLDSILKRSKREQKLSLHDEELLWGSVKDEKISKPLGSALAANTIEESRLSREQARKAELDKALRLSLVNSAKPVVVIDDDCEVLSEPATADSESTRLAQLREARLKRFDNPAVQNSLFKTARRT